MTIVGEQTNPQRRLDFQLITEDTPAIIRARQLIHDLLVEARITINDVRIFDWGISALIEKENAMTEGNRLA